MDPLEEIRLYKHDRPAWIEYAAPRWLPILERETPERRRKMWRCAGADLKRRIRELLDERQSAVR